MAELKHVHISIESKVATLVVDHPPANALNDAVISDLDAAVNSVASDPDVKVIVITADGRFFIAGADINQLDTIRDAVNGEALEIGRSIDARLVLIRADYHLARVALAHGHLAAARTHVERAIAAAQRSGIRLLEAMSVHLLGELLTRQRRFAEAEAQIVESLGLLERLGDRFETACTLRSYARLLVERGDLPHGEAQLQRAAAIFAELGAAHELSITQADLVRLHGRCS